MYEMLDPNTGNAIASTIVFVVLFFCIAMIRIHIR